MNETSTLIRDYTERPIGEAAGKNTQIELCPVCGRPARVERHLPYKGHPATYIHRVYRGDDEGWVKTYERCEVKNAPRGDGLPHDVAADLAVWAETVEDHCRKLSATIAMGWYRPVANGQDAGHYVDLLRAALATLPALTEASDGR